MATIIGMITNDHSRDGGHPWGCLEDLDHFGEGHLPRDGDHPNNSDHHRSGDHPSQVSTKNQIEQSVSFYVCLFVNLWVIELHTQLKSTAYLIALRIF